MSIVKISVFRAETDRLFRLANSHYHACVGGGEVRDWQAIASRVLAETAELDCNRASSYDREQWREAVQSLNSRLEESVERLVLLDAEAGPINGSTAVYSPVATIVSEDARLEFYPARFGKYYLAAENLVYVHAKRFVKGYQGGFWNYYTTSNGAFFVALDTANKLHLVIPENYTSEHMSAEAAGITLTLFVLSRFANARIPQAESERFIDGYHKLREFAVSHAEASAILTAID